LKDYLRAVQSVDDNIGRVLDYLDEQGLAENTIVVYASDQGWYLGEHGWYDKRWMYEPSLKDPVHRTLARSVLMGVRSTKRWSPTSTLPRPSSTSPAPRSLRTCKASHSWPVLEGGTSPDFRDAFYYQYYEYPASHCVRRHYGVRTDRYKLIYFYGIDEWELFDLQEDPDELNNIYASADHADIRAGLETRLSELREELQVPEDKRPIPNEECTYTVGWMGYDAG
jgi:arylsulfatase A-like enzyme